MNRSTAPRRNQLLNYRLDRASLRLFQDHKGDQGRQSLAAHLATDIPDRLELGSGPMPPATFGISVSRRAVGCKDQVPMSADTLFVSQLIRIAAHRPFGVFIARLNRPAQWPPSQQIAQLPAQMVTDVKPRLVRSLLLFVRSDQADPDQLVDLLRLD